jgi:hypothetical protein
MYNEKYTFRKKKNLASDISCLTKLTKNENKIAATIEWHV